MERTPDIEREAEYVPFPLPIPRPSPFPNAATAAFLSDVTHIL